jgi:cell division protein FtsL
VKVRYLAWWVVAVMATGAAYVSYLTLRFETVRLGYELDEATHEHRRLAELQRLVALEVQTLRERQRVHAIAERSLGMASPELARVVVVEARETARESNVDGLPDGVPERIVNGSSRAHSAGRAR